MRPAPTRDIFMTTASGKAWFFLDPEPASVDWRDIAAHLAKICRFGGATPVPYSVAQHSVLVAEQLPPTIRAYGLLHDAHEAYLGDIISPVKAALCLDGPSQLDALTKVHDAAIHAAAGLPWPPPREVAEAVKQADLRALATEARDLLPAHDIPLPCRPMGTIVRPWPWAKAEERFLDQLRTFLPSGMRNVA